MSSEDDEPRAPPSSRGGVVTDFRKEQAEDEKAWLRRQQKQRERGEADSEDGGGELADGGKKTTAQILNVVPVEGPGENFAAEDVEDDGRPRFDASGNPILWRRRRGAATHNSLFRQGLPSQLAQRHPREPAAGLSIDSMSAYAPFQGFPMQWMSQVYDDAATYEGTEYINVPHGKGVFYAGVQGGGLGINDLRPGDRYEGELHLGFASGLGMLTRQDGRVYRGEFLLGRRHGCGAQVDLSAFYEEVARGTDAAEAWERTKEEVAATAERGTYRGDEFESGPVEDEDEGAFKKKGKKGKNKKATTNPYGDGSEGILPSDREHRYCTLAEVEGTVEEAEHLVARARMFEHKPDGAVSTSMTHDGDGTPVPLMQDPLHYPFGTKWMAPGPLGQCFRLPDDETTLEALDAAAHNHEVIWREFNLPRVIEPGTDMARAVRHSEQVASARLRELEPDEMYKAAKKMQRETRAQIEREVRAQQEKEDAAAGKVGGGRKKQRERISDDDLVADASSLSSSISSSGRGGSTFGSMTASLFRGNGIGSGNSENPAALLASALGRAGRTAAAAVASLLDEAAPRRRREEGPREA